MTYNWRALSFLLLSLCALLGSGQLATRAQETARRPVPAKPPTVAIKFPLEYRIVDPDNVKNARLKRDEKKFPPMIVMFPGGKTHEDKDATGPIGRLEGFRGKSKLFPESNDNSGLPVLLAGLRFLERRGEDGKLDGYDVELQGEYNAVKVPAPDKAMQDFLDGKRATFALESTLNYGIIATASTTKLEISRDGNFLYIYSVEGDFSFREGFYTYKSPSLKTLPPPGRKYLYFGEAGKLPDLRIL